MTGTCQQPSPAENRLSLSWLRSPEPHLWCKSVPSRIKKVECVFGNDFMRFFFFQLSLESNSKYFILCCCCCCFHSVNRSLMSDPLLSEPNTYRKLMIYCQTIDSCCHCASLTSLLIRFPSRSHPLPGWSLAPQRQLSACAGVCKCSDALEECAIKYASLHISLFLSLSLYLCSIKKQSILGVNWYQSLFCSALHVCLHWSVVLQLSLSIGAFFKSLLCVIDEHLCSRDVAYTHTIHTNEVVARRLHRTCLLMCRAISRWQNCAQKS